MRDKVGLTLACLNLKKLVRMMAGRPFYFALNDTIYRFFNFFILIKTKRQTSNQKFVFGLEFLLFSLFKKYLSYFLNENDLVLKFELSKK